METLYPHRLQAPRLAKTYQQLPEREESVREDVAAAIQGGLCQTDAHGELEWMTRDVPLLLARYFPTWHGWSKSLPAELRAQLHGAFAQSRKGLAVPPTLGTTWYFPREFGTLKIQLASRDAAGQWCLLLTEKSCDLPAEVLAARHGLSKRESEILFWVGQGKSGEEIGMILSISVRTVEKHTEHVFAKLGVYNRTAAARIAMGG